MKLNELRDKKGATRSRRRVGRGIGSGRGKTSGRGHKGLKSRAGGSVGTFEGGQTPLHMRLPKRGFSNRRFQKHWAIVNLNSLQEAVDAGRINIAETVTARHLREAGLVGRARDGIRLLAKGAEAFKSALTIEVAGASAAARKKLEEAGGKILTAEKPKGESGKADAKKAKEKTETNTENMKGGD